MLLKVLHDIVTNKENTVTTWHEALREVLECSGTFVQSLAKEVGDDRTLLSRYLSGKRRASLKAKQRINCGLGRLLNSKEIEAYLNSVAAYQELRDAHTSEEFQKIPAAPGRFPPLAVRKYFRRDAEDAIYDAFLSLTEKAWRDAKKLRFAIHQAQRKRRIREIDGSLPKTIEIDEFLALCKEHGLDLTPWLRDDEHTQVLRKEEELRLEIRKALFHLAESVHDNPNRTKSYVAERNEAEERIFKAFDAYESAEWKKSEILFDAYRGIGKSEACSEMSVQLTAEMSKWIAQAISAGVASALKIGDDAHTRTVIGHMMTGMLFSMGMNDEASSQLIAAISHSKNPDKSSVSGT